MRADVDTTAEMMQKPLKESVFRDALKRNILLRVWEKE